MATLREIKRRINSVKSTQQITKAMKMVAAAKLRKSQMQLVAARPYAHELGNMLGHIAGQSKKDNRYLAQTKPKSTCYVMITSDKGLCSSFNSNIIRRTVEEMEHSQAIKNHLIVIGRKGYDHFKRLETPIRHHYIDFINNLEPKHAKNIASVLIKEFLAKKYDRVNIVYQEFKSAVQQRIVVEQFLPIPPQEKTEKIIGGYIFDPSPNIILDNIIPMHLNYQMWRIMLESSASEHGARMTAMETATDNATEMIKMLVLYYNQARQAAITNELNEIVSGAEALQG